MPEQSQAPHVENQRAAGDPTGIILSPVSVARWLLLGILIAGIWFFHEFLVPMLAAAIIAFATWPLFTRTRERFVIGTTAASALFTAIVALFLVVPVVGLVIYGVGEVRSLVDWALRVNAAGSPVPFWVGSLPGSDWLIGKWNETIGRPGGISEIVALVDVPAVGNITQIALKASRWSLATLIAGVFLLLSLFVFYRSGDSIVAQLDCVGSKILGARWERLSRVVPGTIGATVSGMTLIAIGEGVVFGLVYLVAGVPSPINFAVITGFLALFPGGAPLAMTSVAIYLGASGSAAAGTGVFVWGTVQLFVVDKTIRPALVGGPIKLPFLPTIVGLVGGVKTMGVVGLFLGPVLMALLVSIWREWVREMSIEEATAKTPPGEDGVSGDVT